MKKTYWIQNQNCVTENWWLKIHVDESLRFIRCLLLLLLFTSKNGRNGGHPKLIITSINAWSNKAVDLKNKHLSTQIDMINDSIPFNLSHVHWRFYGFLVLLVLVPHKITSIEFSICSSLFDSWRLIKWNENYQKTNIVILIKLGQIHDPWLWFNVFKKRFNSSQCCNLFTIDWHMLAFGLLNYQLVEFWFAICFVLFHFKFMIG